MRLQTVLRTLSALGLVAGLALILALGTVSYASAQATPAAGGETNLPNTGDGSGYTSQATPAAGGETNLPNTGDGSTYTSQATPAAGGETNLPNTGSGSTQSSVGGLWLVFAAAALVVIAAVGGRSFVRRS